MLVFELFAVPHLTPRLGVQMSQRVGSVVLVPVYIFLPMLSSVNGPDLAVTVAVLILLFTCFTCSHAVSAFRCGGNASKCRDGEHKQVRISPDWRVSAAASVESTHRHGRHTFRICRTFPVHVCHRWCLNDDGSLCGLFDIASNQYVVARRPAIYHSKNLLPSPSLMVNPSRSPPLNSLICRVSPRAKRAKQFYVGLSLAINNATRADRRGEMNGLSMMMASLARVIAPIVCSSLYAYSINSNQAFPLDYHLVFYLLALVRFSVAWMGWNRITDGGGVNQSDLTLQN